MGRPRAISSTDMDRTLASLKKAGVALDMLTVVVEPGRVSITPNALAESESDSETAKPKEWPCE